MRKKLINQLREIWGGRVPRFLPRWMRERIEVNTREIHRLMALAQARLSENAWVLDAGAGESRFSDYFSHTHYVAADYAIGDAAWDYSNLDVICDLLRVPFADGSFDAVICTQVLEHVREPKAVIAELARSLKPGGELFLSAPQGWAEHQKPHDYFRFTSFALRYMFEAAGLEVQFIAPMGGYFWFLSFHLQKMHYWLFPPSAHPWRELVRVPVTFLLRVIFLFILPIPLFYLDRLDTRKDQTLGYICHCRKPKPRQIDESANGQMSE